MSVKKSKYDMRFIVYFLNICEKKRRKKTEKYTMFVCLKQWISSSKSICSNTIILIYMHLRSYICLAANPYFELKFAGFKLCFINNCNRDVCNALVTRARGFNNRSKTTLKSYNFQF